MPKRNFGAIAGAVGVFVLLAVLFALPKISGKSKEKRNGWEKADVECLPSHANALLHIHPHLTIKIDGSEEVVPAEIGIMPSCMAEVHTHDATGTLHVESRNPKKEFVLGQFFSVWEKQIERTGFTLKVTVNDLSFSENPAHIPLKDGDRIIFEYDTKKE